MKPRILFVAVAAILAASAAMADVKNLESYYFRFDFSKGNSNFITSTNIVYDFVGADTSAVEGPNGTGNAVHITSTAWNEFSNNTVVNSDWTLAMTFRPGTVEGGTILSLGRLPSTGSSAVAICSSSDTDKLYINVVTRNSSGYALEKKNELTGLGDVTQGYHTLVVAYNYADKTLYFYWDGVSKGIYQLTTGYPFGAADSISGIQFNKLITRGDTVVGGFTHKSVSNDSSYSFYDVRLYPGQFSATDAAEYAALYPVGRMGSPFRPNAYIEASGTNKNTNTGNYIDTGYLAKGATTRFAVDYQFLDLRGQQRIFGVRGSFVQGLYVNTTTESGRLAWNFMGAANLVDMGISVGRLRRIAMFDRMGKTIAVTNYVDRAQFYYNDNHSGFLKATSDADNTTYLFAENNSGAKNFGKARIYSFEADESGVPVHFFAPATNSVGEAGFKDIITGDFMGDGNKNKSNLERALRFYDGVGCADDYKYEDGTLYAKLYATSDVNGTVSVASGSAAASAEGWIPYGGNLALEAVPDTRFVFGHWEGDTWAIASGCSTNDVNINISTPYAVQLRAVFKKLKVAMPELGDGASVVFSGSTMVVLSCATEGVSIYYTLDGTTPTTSSTLYEGSFPFSPTDFKTTLKVLAVKDDWFDSDVFEVALVNLAVAPISAYAQSASENLFLHLDGIENAGVGVHEAAPSTWADLTGNMTVTSHNSPSFSGDAYTPNQSSWFSSASDAVTNALAGSDAAFTLELVISHTEQKTQNIYEYWVHVGDYRTLIVDIRPDGESTDNPLVQGVRYHMSVFDNKAKLMNSNVTSWGKRQYITVVCDGTTATTYCNGKTQIHSVTSDPTTPTSNNIYIGAHNANWPLWSGAEICAVRMTGRILTEDERMRNFYVDSQRFGLEGAPVGYRITNGNVQIRITEGIEGVEFSTDGGTTWATGEVWADIDAELTLSARVAASMNLPVTFKGLPDGVPPSGNSVTFTPTKPCAITVSAPRWANNDSTGSFDSADNWIGGGLPFTDGDFTVNISGDTVITVTNTYNLGVMTVQGTGNVTFVGDGCISAATLNVASGLTVDTSGILTVAGVAGAGNVVLTPASDTITLSSASTLTGDLTIKADSSLAFNVNAATSVSKFYVNAATNSVVTLTAGSGGSFVATSEVIVQHGVLQQGSDNVLGTTPKITVRNGGTFDINGKTIRQETPIYIEGTGAGNWPYALETSSTMASGNYLYTLYLTADAAIGKGQFNIGRDDVESFIYLNGHTLTAKSWLTIRNVNAQAGTISIVNELRGHGTITKLVMESDAKFYPDGEDYLNVTETLSGTMKLDLSGFELENENEIKLVKVPAALTNSVDMSDVPDGWRLRQTADSGNVCYSIVKVFTLALNQRKTGGMLDVEVEVSHVLLANSGLSATATPSEVNAFLNAPTRTDSFAGRTSRRARRPISRRSARSPAERPPAERRRSP